MSNPAPASLSDDLISALRSFPEGATIEEIERALAVTPHRKATQFGLSVLVTKNRVTVQADRYRLCETDATDKASAVRTDALPDADVAASPVAPAVRQPVLPTEPVDASPAASATVPAPAPEPPPAAAVVVADATPTAAPAPSGLSVSNGSSAPTDPGLPAQPVTPPATAPATPDAHRFDELFDVCVLTIVPGMMPKLAAAAYLQTQALQFLTVKEERRAFVADAKARLQAFTLADAERYEIAPEQYEGWRAAYFGDDEGPAASDAETAAADEPKKANGPAKRAPAPRSTSPRGVAKMIADQMTQLTGGKNPMLHLFVTTAALAVIAPVVQTLTRSPAVTIVAVGLVLVVALLIAWVRGGAVAEEPTPTDEPRPAGDAAGAQDRDAAATPGRVRADAPVTPTLSRRGRLLIAATAVAVVTALVAGGVWYRTTLQHPSTAEVRDYLNTSFAVPVRVVTLELTHAKPSASGCEVSYQAVVETTAALYRPVDTAEYLRANAAEPMTAIDAAKALLNAPHGDRLRSRAGAPPAVDLFPPTLATSMLGPKPANPAPVLMLLQTQTPAGTSLMTSGVVFAFRRDGKWAFTSARNTFDASRLPGQPKPAGTAVFAVDQPADAERLKAVLAEHVAYAAKVQAP